MNFLVNNYNGATTYRDYQAGNLSLVTGGQLATLATNGASITFSFEFIEQVSAGVSFAKFVVDNGETYTVEWRTSTDGSTWTAWATLNSAAVAAFTATANNALYIQVRYTRTSAGAPPIAIYGFVFRFTYVSTATSGRGYIEDINWVNDLKELFQGMAESVVLQKAGSPAFDVSQLIPNLATKGNKPIIYVSNLGLSKQKSVGCQAWEQRGRVTIGVKAAGGQYYAQADQQFSIIMATFSAMRWSEATFDFTYKGDAYISAHVGKFGLSDFASETSTMYTDSVKNEQVREMVVTFTLTFKNNYLIQ